MLLANKELLDEFVQTHANAVNHLILGLRE